MYEKMKNIGQIVANVFNQIDSFLKPNITTKDIEVECVRLLSENGAKSSCNGYRGFPGDLCVSVNNEVCHAIPGSKKIQSGDLVSIDIVANKDEYNGDSCVSFIIGEGSKEKRKILKATYECMWNTIEHIKSGIRVGDLGYLMESYANRAGYTVVRDFTGHGIGKKMHEDPNVPFFGRRGTGEMLYEGQCITIEPMLVLGSPRVKILKDDWTAVTENISCQFEHTVLITANGYEVLTYNKYDEQNGKKSFNIAQELK